MPRFNFYYLNGLGRIALGKHAEAADLNAAIRSASEECKAHPAGPFRGFEIWQDARLLFTSESLLSSSLRRSTRG